MYNPFNKAIAEINLSDLNLLIEQQICEGWFIEYKSEIPKTSGGRFDNLKIAKSISAFSNTKGGWIFWGITCDSNRPIFLNGVSIQPEINFDDQVSNIINSNISPAPIYHIKRILVEDSSAKEVVVIQVEESPTPPYITSQGIIYQRENNESKPIRDRYIIEKLNEKTSNYQNAIEGFSSFDLPQTKGQSESNQSFLQLYLFPIPFNTFRFANFYSSDFFSNVADKFYQATAITVTTAKGDVFSTDPLSLGFNSVFYSDKSVIVRKLTDENLIYKSIAVELFDNGNLKFNTPLVEFFINDTPEYYKDGVTIEYLLDRFSPKEMVKDIHPLPFHGRKYSDLPLIERRKQTDFVNHVKLIDGVELIFMIFSLVSVYKQILKENNFPLETRIGLRANITDCWRKFIFFEDEDYLEKIKKFNIPLSPKSEIEIPVFNQGNSYQVDLFVYSGDCFTPIPGDCFTPVCRL